MISIMWKSCLLKVNNIILTCKWTTSMCSWILHFVTHPISITLTIPVTWTSHYNASVTLIFSRVSPAIITSWGLKWWKLTKKMINVQKKWKSGTTWEKKFLVWGFSSCNLSKLHSADEIYSSLIINMLNSLGENFIEN